MPKIYKLSRAGVRVLYKIRHHKGHGIHSPFVFSFITRVIEEKTPYYVYEDIPKYLESFPKLHFEESKTDRLLFKTINHFNPKNILALGVGNGISTLYLTAASSTIECKAVELSPEKYNQAKELLAQWNRQIELSSEKFSETNTPYDGIFINLREYSIKPADLKKYLFSIKNENTFIIIDGIRTNRKHQALWKMFIKSEEVKVSLDLFHVGLLFFNSKYFKRNFKLSF